MYRAVLDSCVLFPMYLRDTLLCMSEAGLYVPHWSQEILDGATRNLVNTGRLTTTQAMRLEGRIKEAFPTALIVVPDNIIQLMTNYPNDRHVLAAAVVGKANIIVTSNLKHFQDQDLALWQVQAKSPDEFLTELYNLYPQQVIEVLQRQSQSLKKPAMSFFELLELLSREAPRFTNNIKSQT
ncbi:MAG: PIN domain-containing protein [Nostoc sp. NMS7]|uniref:PIN domain-containing protein n=2 Tax=Nostoc TaxID=1177 RepID=UPI0025E18201|nr:PIN domain-containing protein [Nostoc sp. NMS7]MBN3950179.1 PIN domain-containing protein [Nostoc sp. NMS7]